MDIFKICFIVLTVVVIPLAIGEVLFIQVNVSNQYAFTLINGITASTSIIIGFTGTIIGAMYRGVTDKRDKEARNLFLSSIFLLIPTLVVLLSVYWLLVMDGTQTSLALKGGLASLMMGFYSFGSIVITIGERLKKEESLKHVVESVDPA